MEFLVEGFIVLLKWALYAVVYFVAAAVIVLVCAGIADKFSKK